MILAAVVAALFIAIPGREGLPRGFGRMTSIDGNICTCAQRVCMLLTATWTRLTILVVVPKQVTISLRLTASLCAPLNA